MKQHVNLYLPEFRKKKDLLDALRMLQISGVAVLALLLASGWQYWGVHSATAELDAANVRREAAVQATSDLRLRFGAQSPDQSFIEQNNALEATLNEKRAILEVMNSNRLGENNTSGFSEYLADLSRYHLDGVSLSHISLNNSGKSVNLSGSVLRGELVTLYLQRLSQGEPFKGMSFNNFEMSEINLSAAQNDGQDAITAMQFAVSTGQ